MGALPESASPTAAPRLMLPVTRGERVELIDVVRGFALLGILLVNMMVFAAPIQLWFVPVQWWPGPLDQAARLFILFFAQGKFYALFSMLFGLGLTIQMERAEARGVGSAGFFARRLTWLLLIGLAHAFLVWMGDILVLYAVVGFLLIPFRRRKVRTLAIWAVSLLLVPLVIFAIPVFLADVSDDRSAQMSEMIETATAAYSSGDLGRIFEQRVDDILFIWVLSFLSTPNFLGLFLVGMIVGKTHFLQNLPRNMALVRRWIWPLLALGVAGNAAFVILTHDAPGPTSVLSWIAQACVTFGAPAMTLFYVSAIILLARSEHGRRRLRPLAAVGRMALTNYLMQSLVSTAIFNGYGWVGLYGQISTFAGVLLSCAIFLLQIPLSNWWLEHFRFGPAEWLWRSLTYRRPQPFRRSRWGGV